jgi:hypothetical protein
MKIFISWSGDRSRQLATALHRWLPIVIQSIEPYLSSEDIEKGTRWATSISQELETSNFGLLCLTPENLTAPWIYFEAGALAKVVKQSHVVPLLFDLAPSDIQGPLTQFQSANLEHADMLRLLKAINAAGGDAALEEGRLETAFSALWGQFHKELKTIEGSSVQAASSTAKRSEDGGKVLEELLVLARQQSQILTSSDGFRPIIEQLQEELRRVLRQTLAEGQADLHHTARKVCENWEKILHGWVRMYPSIDQSTRVPFHNRLREMDEWVADLTRELRLGPLTSLDMLVPMVTPTDPVRSPTGPTGPHQSAADRS